MKIVCILFIFFIGCFYSNAQHQKHKIVFSVNVYNQPVFLDSSCTITTTAENYIITKLKFYIGNIVLHYKNAVVHTITPAYYLIDYSKPNNIKIPTLLYDSISFSIGVDSITNELDLQEGDLDPVNNMYWTWQSGYINFKIEGTFNGDNFTYHIGGYTSPFNAHQIFGSKVTCPQNLVLNIQLAPLLNKIATIKNIMSPSQHAVNIAQLIKNNCTIQCGL
jgi:hypothetical protein